MVAPRGKKNTSKRQTLKVKHKIRKKVTASNHKARKEANKAKKAGVNLRQKKSSLAKDKKKMHIPSLWPFKQQELMLQKQAVDRKDEDRKKLAEANRKKAQSEAKKQKNREQKAPTRPVYNFASTTEAADLIISIVDARDPLASRCPSCENMEGKKSIIVVTKGDLVPKENLKQWLNYLRRKSGNPVIALTRREDSSKPFGFKNLVKLLQSYEFKFIGVVGYPGTGKHTVESYLKLPSCNLPRKTKTQSASIIDADDVEMNSVDLFLLNKPQSAINPLPLLKRVLERTRSKDDLLMKMVLPDFDDAEQLLKSIMKEMNLQSATDAVRQFLKRWNGIGHCCALPDDELSDLKGGEKDKDLIHKNLSVEELGKIYTADATEIDAMHKYLVDIEERLAANGDDGVTRNVTGMKEKWVTKKETKGDLNPKAAAARSTITQKQQKAVIRPDLKRLFTIKCPSDESGKKLVSGGPEPFVFGANQENDMDFSDDEDTEEAPQLKELDDVEMGSEEEEDLEEEDMDDLEMLEEDDEDEED